MTGAKLWERYCDFSLGFFWHLKVSYHFPLTAQELVSFLAVYPQVDLSDPASVCDNMEMFFCHSQSEVARFREIFWGYFTSEKAEEARTINRLTSSLAKASQNLFIQLPKNSTVSDQKVYMTLPHYEAERVFSTYEERFGKVLYSTFIHAGFLNLYEDFQDTYDSMPEFSRGQLLGSLTKSLSGFVSFVKKEIPEGDDICRKAVEVSARFQKAGTTEHLGDEKELPPDEEEARRQLAESMLRYQELSEHHLTVAEDLLSKDIRLLTKKDIAQLSEYIKKNAHKFRSKINRANRLLGRRDFLPKKTVKEAFHTGLIPMRLSFSAPKRKKTSIVALLDISPSCISGVSILIHLLIRLRQVFPGGIRIFFFTDEVKDMTRELFLETPEQVIASAEKTGKRTVSDHTRIFEGFLSEYKSVLKKDTLFFVMGDLRNNYLPFKKEALDNIRRRVKAGGGRMFLLNPRQKNRWYGDDSLMKVCEPLFDRCYPAVTVGDLILFLEEMPAQVP